MESKEEARRRFRAVRNALDCDTRARFSAVVKERALSLAEAYLGGYVFCYVSQGAEVGTHDLLSELLSRGHKVAVPRIVGNEMLAVEITASTRYEKGPLSISEPTNGKVVKLDQISIVLAPLVSYGDGGKRLGQGGGYYDRFLKTQAITVGLAFSAQRGEFPTEPHDVLLDAVITECGVEIFNEDRCRKV